MRFFVRFVENLAYCVVIGCYLCLLLPPAISVCYLRLLINSVGHGKTTFFQHPSWHMHSFRNRREITRTTNAVAERRSVLAFPKANREDVGEVIFGAIVSSQNCWERGERLSRIPPVLTHLVGTGGMRNRRIPPVLSAHRTDHGKMEFPHPSCLPKSVRKMRNG